MDDPFEIELKLEYDPADVDALLAAEPLAAASSLTQRLVSTYYDTADGVLAEHGFTLRVREVGGRFVQTIKADGAPAAGLFARPEWEMEVADATPLLDPAQSPIAPLVADKPLVPLFASDIARTVWTIEASDARIEVALDRGEVRAGKRRDPVHDLELELKDGSAIALFDLARRLDAAAPLRLGILSKSERGQRLSAGKPKRAVKAEPIILGADADGREAFATIARACLRQFRLNETLVIAHGNAAAVHQARVGLRRLRSAFSLFAPMLAGDLTAARLAGDLRWLAGALGEVRDLDVLIAAHGESASPQLVGARDAGMTRVRAALADPRSRRLMLDLAQWLAVGDWRVRASDIAAMPVRQLAADLLDRTRKRLKRRGHDLAELDDEHRHRARIAAKKLRYASEFFACLWSTGKGKRRHAAFAEVLETLQDQLGALNDLATAPHLIARLGLDPAAVTPPHDRADLLARAAEAHERLMDMKRFWR
ncbi:CYTH and CHAD domain-containing protein [Sphingomonas nostoxanthinifaciens]|uniref:CYTH and CHAD domain-containing protein n=1 Tax=Sphingomonas nostoxanthinifaciens TaxID=2872652 RepID=UPI001CC1ECB2|nr:CYTH and CHAD domain-containing protein [Sphingomonas nostoxanthinifaciens]UAK25074.1 CHAD domain-containing protein [Sphingomonas nostoxanthinifaciens]